MLRSDCRVDNENETYLHNCRYNRDSDVDSLCPVFEIGDIVTEAQGGNDSYENIALWVCITVCFSIYIYIAYLWM